MNDEAIALFKKHGAYYVPTISAGRYVAEKSGDADYYSPLVRPKAAAIGPQIQATFARAYKAGVKIAFGTEERRHLQTTLNHTREIPCCTKTPRAR